MPMNLIRQSDKLANEFLENSVENYEITIATNFKRSDREEYSGTYWDFEGQRNCFIEDAQEGIFKLIYEELDSFLKDKGHEVEPLSDTYMVLARKFVLAKIHALGIAQGLLNGETYTYSNDKSLEDESLLWQIPPLVSTRKTRKSTIELEYYVNVIAREVMEKYPDNQKQYLAVDVSEKLESKHGIKKEPATILRDYLGKFPNF
jgi:hypothetical protein